MYSCQIEYLIIYYIRLLVLLVFTCLVNHDNLNGGPYFLGKGLPTFPSRYWNTLNHQIRAKKLFCELIWKTTTELIINSSFELVLDIRIVLYLQWLIICHGMIHPKESCRHIIGNENIDSVVTSRYKNHTDSCQTS